MRSKIVFGGRSGGGARLAFTASAAIILSLTFVGRSCLAFSSNFMVKKPRVNISDRSPLFPSLTPSSRTLTLNVANEGLDDEKLEETASSCPFSMKFTRYRVPVTSGKDSGKQISGGIFGGIKMSMNRSAIEKKYAEDVKQNNFIWAEPSSASFDTSEKEERIVQGMYGVFASATVWRKGAELLDMFEPGDSNRAVVTIPNSSMVGLKQLADIINWLGEQKGNPFIESRATLNALVDEEAPVPTIILSVSEGSNSVLLPKSDISSAQVEAATKSWVKRILVNLGICPFTKAVTKSGQGLGDLDVPVGRIAYHHSKSGMNEIPLLFADTWEAILDMVQNGPSGKKGVSSILLSAPGFDSDFTLFAGPIFAMLEQNVGAARAEPIIGVVCFHPKYKTPDGKSWPGFGHMHSVPRLRSWLDDRDEELSNKLTTEEVAGGGAYQRRTPFATINVLRADQLEAAEGRRETRALYSTNISRLYHEGYDKLELEMENDKSFV